mmetsp:Transcript_24871/g.43489  ORF Transcript_24871/g.43489 Transcript_24871/m.43489 type:complete len:326 (-) Transcript_24871:89-1066(-)
MKHRWKTTGLPKNSRADISELLVLFTLLFVLTSSVQYDHELAYNLAILCSAAYASPAQVNSWQFPNPQCTNFSKNSFRLHKAFISDSEALGFIGVREQEKQIVVVFKGTNSTDDLITDIKSKFYFFDECIVKNISLGYVHHGFCDYYRGLEAAGIADVAAALRRDLYPGYQMIITGHSLGGAAAALFALDVAQRYPLIGNKPWLYTLGQPRTGDAAFAARLFKACSAVFRVVHRADMVAHLPLCCHSIPFMECKTTKQCPYHSMNEVWYDNDMPVDNKDYQLCTGIGENRTCEGWVEMSIRDHLSYFGFHVGSLCSTEPETQVIY